MATFRRWIIRAAGATAIAASCWLLFVALRDSWRDVVAMLVEKSLLAPLVVSSVLYGIALAVLSNAWRNLVGRVGGVPLNLRQGLSIYAIANVAKYLPGNVFHFAARQLLGRNAGPSHRAIAQATVLELALMVICTLVLISIAGGRHLPEHLRAPAHALGFTAEQAWVALILTMLACGAAAIAIMMKTGLFRRALGIDLIGLALPATFVSLFLVGQSWLAAHLGDALNAGRSHETPALLIAVTYLLAWLAGLLVPGAPGGLGVREGVLVFLLRGATGEAFALALAVLMRFVSTAGDAVFALVGYALSRVSPRRRTEHGSADRLPD